MAYKTHLRSLGIEAELFDQWSPKFEAVDIFHFFSVMPGSLQLCSHIKSRKKPLVISPNLWVTESTKHLYPDQDIRCLLPLADVIVVNSAMEAAALSAVYSVPETAFAVVHNGCEADFLERVDPDLFRNHYRLSDRPYVINVANVEPRKNQLAFLRALKCFPGLQLLTLGHVRDREYADACLREAGDQFAMLDPVEYGSQLIRSALAGAKFFAMPSTLETPSIAALEAYTSGVPVLITSEGSTSEYFGDSVVYVDPYSDESLRSAISTILKKPPIASLSKNKFLWTTVLKPLGRVYENLLRS